MTDFKRAAIQAAIGHLDEVLLNENSNILTELIQCRAILNTLIEHEEFMVKLNNKQNDSQSI